MHDKLNILHEAEESIIPLNFELCSIIYMSGKVIAYFICNMAVNISRDVMKSGVSVYVRVKPPLGLTSSEQGNGSRDACSTSLIKCFKNSIYIESKTQKAVEDSCRSSTYTLSNCSGVIDGSTRDVFKVVELSTRYIHDCIENNKSGLICCYGQSSSGKTYTMFGSTLSNKAGQHERGLVHMAMEHILSIIDTNKYTIALRAFEVYDERIIDLITSSRDEAKPDTRRKISDGDECNKVVVHGMADFEAVVKMIESKRSMSFTSLNQSSSRSHGIVRIFIELLDDKAVGAISSLTFVDLAGSERQAKTKASGAILREGIRINKSLLTLGAVVRSLSNPKESHIPWRESKLTSVLKPFLHKDANIGFILCISSEDMCLSESISTLRFGAMLMDMRLIETANQGFLPKSFSTEEKEIANDFHESNGKSGIMPCVMIDSFLCLLLAGAHTVLLFWNFLW